MSDELWNAAKDRQSATRRTITRTGNIGFARRPQYLFSGLSKCRICGAGFIMAGRNRLACFGAREKGTCDNRLNIRRDEVEARVLRALQEKLLQQDLFEEFCDEFTREMNRLRMGKSRSRRVRPRSRLSTFGGRSCRRDSTQPTNHRRSCIPRWPACIATR